MRPKREGTYIYLQLIHVVAWNKPTQHCKAIIFQLKIIFLKKNVSLIPRMIYIDRSNPHKQKFFEFLNTFEEWILRQKHL